MPPRSALADHDLVIINAGSSAGSEDYTASVVEELGQLLVHGIAIRPGHPVGAGHGPVRVATATTATSLEAPGGAARVPGFRHAHC